METPGEGLVVITVTAFGECGPVTETVELEFTVSADEPLSALAEPILYPNPSRSGAIYIQNLSDKLASQMRGLRLLNGAGQLMFETESISGTENGVLRVSWPASLGPAYYILDMYDENGQSLHRWRVIRQ